MELTVVALLPLCVIPNLRTLPQDHLLSLKQRVENRKLLPTTLTGIKNLIVDHHLTKGPSARAPHPSSLVGGKSSTDFKALP